MTGDQEQFTFSWLALKLLGRNLYSNPWSALSELVANGLDAGADTVYVYVDARDKNSATIEVIDDGSGMSRDDIKTYAKVGFNKRQHRPDGEPANPKVTGRKGIGKLAALYLAKHFFLSTKHSGAETLWELDATDSAIKDDDHPALKVAGVTPTTPNDGLWRSLPSGTRLTLVDVDLAGYGPKAIEALGSRLANQFLLPDNATPQIRLWVRTGYSVEAAYERVEKRIAFGNLVGIVTNFNGETPRPAHFEGDTPQVRLPAKGLPLGEYVVQQRRETFSADSIHLEALQELIDLVDESGKTFRGIGYNVTGWIGVHATIIGAEAQKNDARFEKNKFYNPAQLRLYVRDKLASEHLLGQLGITGTYINYIEGEISFDLLDSDEFADIATSNRQDFDETDLRVTLLRGLVRPIVSRLISMRDSIANDLSKDVKAEKDRLESAAKRQFSMQLEEDFARHDEIPLQTRAELQQIIVNKIEGEISIKTDFRIFISHAKKDLPFAQFVDESLRARGAKVEEIFFTSRSGSTAQLLDVRHLGVVIKECITSANTLIFYLTSRNFQSSEFCLFEGGAGWATRAVGEYRKLNMDFGSIPAFLTDGRGEATLIDDGAITLTPTLHNYIVLGILNPMIEHLNRGREISGDALIPLFSAAEIPTAVEMDDAGRVAADYFDPRVLRQWQLLVEPASEAYLIAYKSVSSR